MLGHTGKQAVVNTGSICVSLSSNVLHSHVELDVEPVKGKEKGQGGQPGLAVPVRCRKT